MTRSRPSDPPSPLTDNVPRHLDLGKRERQIMEAIYSLGRATIAEVREQLTDPPSYSAVRTMVGKLEDKGLLHHEIDGPRYVYEPTVPVEEVAPSTLRRIVAGLFGGSTTRAVSTLLDVAGEDLSQEELDDLAALIERRRRDER
jgi:predicted transcriptional regulator